MRQQLPVSQNTLQLSHKLLTRFTTAQGNGPVITSNLLRYIRGLDWAQIIKSHLYCCLDNTFPRPASTSTSAAASGCSMPRRRGRSGVTLFVSTNRTADLHSQVTFSFETCSQVTVDFHSQFTSPLRTCLQVHCDFHSQVSQLSGRACKCTVTFTLKSVTSQDMLANALWLSLSSQSPLRMCLQVHCDFHSQASDLAAVIVPFRTGLPLWHISFHGAVILLVWAWYCQLVPWVLCVECPLWAGSASDSICSDTVTCPFGQGRTLCFPIFLWLKFLLHWACPCNRCHLLK